MTSPEPYPVDEYIWLAGRPLLMIRSQFDANWNRLPDVDGICSRLGDNGNCGTYFIVTDQVTKPILMLDSHRRITGTGEYTPFGELNRVEAWGVSISPYGENTGSAMLADIAQPIRELKLDVRTQFDVLDTEACTEAGITDYRDPTYISDPATGTIVAGPYGGYHQGNFWTDWFDATPLGGHFQVMFQPNGNNLHHPNSPGCSDSTTNWNYEGVALRGYEYRRYQAGATRSSPPSGSRAITSMRKRAFLRTGTATTTRSPAGICSRSRCWRIRRGSWGRLRAG